VMIFGFAGNNGDFSFLPSSQYADGGSGGFFRCERSSNSRFLLVLWQTAHCIVSKAVSFQALVW
jgi:hypothetical protein